MKSPKPHFVRRATFEIERKFAPSSNSLYALRHNSGNPPFRKFTFEGQHLFEDVYYDHRALLQNQGIWLRCRSGTWQAKIRQGGGYTQSYFQELSDITEINTLISDYVKDANFLLGTTGSLQKTAQFTTSRQSWNVNERFSVVIDQTNFGHIVGEVEQTYTGGEHNAQTASKSNKDIEDFMSYHHWAFPQGRVEGKLSAYFAWRKNLCDE